MVLAIRGSTVRAWFVRLWTKMTEMGKVVVLRSISEMELQSNFESTCIQNDFVCECGVQVVGYTCTCGCTSDKLLVTWAPESYHIVNMVTTSL